MAGFPLARWTRRFRCLATLYALGCAADLKRVHTPDLLAVSEAEATRHAAGSPGGPAETGKASSSVISNVPARETWKVYTSLGDRDAMFDGKSDTAALSQAAGARDQFVLIDLGQMCVVREVIQLHAGTAGFPRRYRIDVAGEHNFPYSLAYVGDGNPLRSAAVLRRPRECRFLRMTLLETSSDPWDIAELEIR